VIANNYATNKLIGDLALTYGQSEELEVRLELMQADFSTRQASGFNNLMGQQISDYHDVVFGSVFDSEAAEAAWTAYYVVRALDDYEIWRTPSFLKESAIFFQMGNEMMFGDDPQEQLEAFEWMQDMFSGILYNPITEVETECDDVLLQSVLEYGLGHCRRLSD
jgi:hypothetical protein